MTPRPHDYSSCPREKQDAWYTEHGSEDRTAPNGQDATPFVPKYKTLAVFIREYQPISYTLEGILPSGVFYFLTARRSTGKTAFLVAALFAIILGAPEILGVKVRKGKRKFVEQAADKRYRLTAKG